MTRPTHTQRIVTLEKDKAAAWRKLTAKSRAIGQARDNATITTAQLRRAGRHTDADRVQDDLLRTLRRLTAQGTELERSYDRACQALDDAHRAARAARR